MSVEAIIAILTGAGTFIGGIVLAIRGLSGDKFQRRVTESAALLTGYTEMVANLRKEIEAVRVAHGAEITRMQTQHATDLQNQHDLHDRERVRWEAERTRMEERMEQLEAQVTAVMFRPADTRGRSGDA